LKSKEEILDLLLSICSDNIPVNWNDKTSIKSFKEKSDSYAKFFNKLNYEEQGWITEQFNKFLKG